MIHVSKDNPGKLIVISNSIKSISFSSKKDGFYADHVII